jgi:predicted kinase
VGAAELAPALWHLFERQISTLDSRVGAGRIRECHGDLHCRNLVRHAGRLIAFDCLEFDPAFRRIDVADEIAFLWMDLQRRDAKPHAAAFLNAYLQASGDYAAARLVTLYGTHRALIRAKVAILEADGARTAESRSRAWGDYAAYLKCAEQCLTLRSGGLVLMSGLSGSGKTWLASRLARLLGAVHVRSDVERKRLSGLSELARSGSTPGRGIYESEMNVRTYRRLAECAADSLTGGFTTIVDATFQRREDRMQFARIAEEAQVPAVIVRCEAPISVLEQRIRARTLAGTDASEADHSVLEWQRTHLEPIGPDEGLHVIDADTTSACVESEVSARLRRALR